MKVLFLQFGTKYYSVDNKYYTDGSLNEKVWIRYLKYTNQLTVLGKKLLKNSSMVDIKKLNVVPSKIDLILVEDLYNPKINYFNLKKRKQIYKVISEQIDKNDKIVIRSLTNDYNIYAAQYCLKNNKDFVVEITGFGFSLWYHDRFFGKIMAVAIEQKMKRIIKKCPHVLYVTDSSLQKRYPNNYHNVGCSDVEIEIDEKLINNNKMKYLNHFELENAVVGTIGPIDSKLKGQEYVIRALSKINRKQGFNLKYELVGRGDTNYLDTIAKKYGFEKNIKFIGEINHDKIYEWFDHIDVYIQPSFQEGLCRSIVEAMSRGCIVFASNAGGNTELVSSKYIFKKGKTKDIIKVFEDLSQKDLENILDEQYKTVQKYEKNKLNEKRNKFYDEFFDLKKEN